MSGEHHHGTHVVEPASAGDRLRWLRRNARRWLLAIVLLVVACLVGAGWSFGLFTDSSANPHNVVTAGTMTQDNTAENTAIMSASNMVPGDRVEGDATIRNVGGAEGDFTLTVKDVQDVPGPNGGPLSAALVLTVHENDATRPIYQGPLTGLAASLGTWQADEERTYRFDVRFAGSTNRADNKFQGSSVTATFEWNAVQTH